MALFELGLTTIGKNFFKIHHTHLPGKEIKEIVLFYYKVLHYFQEFRTEFYFHTFSGRRQKERIATGPKREILNENSKTVQITWTSCLMILRVSDRVGETKVNGKS